MYRRGKRIESEWYTLLYRTNGLDSSRFAVVARKRIGSAVRRNRIKRVARELFRRNQSSLACPVDLIFFPKKAMVTESYHAMAPHFLESMRRIIPDGEKR